MHNSMKWNTRSGFKPGNNDSQFGQRQRHHYPHTLQSYPRRYDDHQHYPPPMHHPGPIHHPPPMPDGAPPPPPPPHSDPSSDAGVSSSQPNGFRNSFPGHFQHPSYPHQRPYVRQADELMSDLV